MRSWQACTSGGRPPRSAALRLSARVQVSARAPGHNTAVCQVGAKLAGVHWWWKTASHAAELTAGYYNTWFHDGYGDVMDVLARHHARASFTCVEMRDCEHPPEAKCSPQGALVVFHPPLRRIVRSGCARKLHMRADARLRAPSRSKVLAAGYAVHLLGTCFLFCLCQQTQHTRAQASRAWRCATASTRQRPSARHRARSQSTIQGCCQSCALAPPSASAALPTLIGHASFLTASSHGALAGCQGIVHLAPHVCRQHSRSDCWPCVSPDCQWAAQACWTRSCVPVPGTASHWLARTRCSAMTATPLTASQSLPLAR